MNTRSHSPYYRFVTPTILCAIMLVAQFILHPSVAWAIDTCYAVADEGDRFVSLNKTTGKTSDIGPTGVADIEAMAFAANATILYAANAGEMGTLNIVTGDYTPLNAIGKINHSGAEIVIDDLDALSWDPITNVLYGAQRQIPPVGSGLPDELYPDLLIQIDLNTGQLKPGVFNGADYVTVTVTSKLEADIDDMAFNPLTGALYGIANDGGENGTLLIINKRTGSITEIGPVIDINNQNQVIDDIEGLAFFNDGRLYASTGDGGPDPADQNKLFHVDPASGKATLVGVFPNNYRDYEALACLTATIADDDQDSLVNIGEDINGDGNLTNDDSDGDGTPNYLDADDDNDKVSSILEDANSDGNLLNDDTDRDGIPNYLDVDDDGDGILTKDEDSNGDGNLFNDDDDADTVPNFLEGGDTDADGTPDQSDADDDNDSVLTKDENVDGKDGPMSDDTDLDGIANYLDVDDDNDSILTKVELTGPQPADVDGDGKLNYLDTDADGDTLPDAAEWSTGSGDRLRDCTAVTTICFANDADKDSFANFVDTDSDGDGLLDKDELADSDGDGVPDWLDTDVFAVGERIYLPIVRR